MMFSIFGWIFQLVWVKNLTTIPGRKVFIELSLDDLKYKKFLYAQFFKIAVAIDTPVDKVKLSAHIAKKSNEIMEVLNKMNLPPTVPTAAPKVNLEIVKNDDKSIH